MSNCSILRIGPIDSENGNAAMLRSAIAAHFHRDSSPCASSSSSSSSSSGAENSPNNLLAISNRYFDASILLSGLDEPLDNNVLIKGETICHPQEDGIILIFNASLPSSFDTLGQHHSTAMHNDKCGELLRLCIGVAHGPSPLSDGSKQSEEEYSRRVLWCLDRGYEYVEVDVTPEGMTGGFEERDKDGYARVVEAIGSCMWSSHVMKRRDVGGGVVGVGSASVPATVLKKNVENDEGGESQSKSQPHTTEKETESISPPANDSEREKAAMASLLQGVTNEPTETDTIPKEETTQQQQQHQDEMAFHQLEHVISEAKRIRESSKDNSMSDEERRDRAGDAAMKLMGLLDSFGLEDDDTDEGSHSSEDEQ